MICAIVVGFVKRPTCFASQFQQWRHGQQPPTPHKTTDTKLAVKCITGHK